jgi:pimeloyl-ACP methyl ester carboxylesterase
MKNIYVFLWAIATLHLVGQSQTTYGNDPQAGRYYAINGIRMYVETYGEGKPLVLIHGNGGSIEHLRNQISHFKKTRKVLVADTRGHGKSGFIEGQIYNYNLLAKDWAVLLDSLHVTNVDIFGWSDGGIIGMLLARDYPSRVGKVFSFGANMTPGEDAIEVRMLRGIRKLLAGENPASPAEKNARAITQMMLDFPKEDLASFGKVRIPVMVATADHDLILLEHSLKIYRSLGNAAFLVMGMANHFMPWDEPDRLNNEIEGFFNKPFQQKNLVPKDYEFLLD